MLIEKRGGREAFGRDLVRYEYPLFPKLRPSFARLKFTWLASEPREKERKESECQTTYGNGAAQTENNWGPPTESDLDT